VTGAADTRRTTPFSPPVVTTYGATDRSAPLVVLLHGRGSNEREILGLAGAVMAARPVMA
jgi:phospholipase/carboxylesterase